MSMAPKKINKTPTTSGVYFFWQKNKIIYVGKAANLKSRLSSYFNKSNIDSRKTSMIQIANKITWRRTSSSIEALVLESLLIKKHKPQFNVALRDDKQYFYVGFTKEECPRVFLTHQPQNPNSKFPGRAGQIQNSIEYIGPFTEGHTIKSTLKMLRHIFPYCTHKGLPKNCLWYALGLCPLSANSTSEEAAACRKNIEAIRDILRGNNKNLVRRLEKEMTKLAKEENFEGATKLRDQMTALKNIYAHQNVLNQEQYVNFKQHSLYDLPEGLLKYLPRKDPREWRIEGYDISNIQGQEATGSLVSFAGSKPLKNLYKKFRIKTVKGANDVAMMREIIGRRLNHYKEWPLPDIFLIDGGRPQINAVNNALFEWSHFASTDIEAPRGKQKLPIIIGLAKRNEELYLTTVKKPYALNKNNSVLLMFMCVRDESHRFAKSYHSKLHKKAMLFE
ncbi:MAG: hypothetical protein A3B75_02050 [Candidatus Terrybacteria bacterium RIFCSPHIGHO2_02_FULL_43_14]|nr:MAG: hypothetical protein A3B75_02050 [Candidatus Terrybacteria bacterium RIFCSPHIGHO2_02_FULL_43_14]